MEYPKSKQIKLVIFGKHVGQMCFIEYMLWWLKSVMGRASPLPLCVCVTVAAHDLVTFIIYIFCCWFLHLILFCSSSLSDCFSELKVTVRLVSDSSCLDYYLEYPGPFRFFAIVFEDNLELSIFCDIFPSLESLFLFSWRPD